MKRFIFKAAVFVLILCLFSIPAMASMVDNQSSLTADFSRFPAKAAIFGTSDTGIYNPAGTAWMDDGKYFGLSFKAMIKDWQHTKDGKTYESTDLNMMASPNGVYKNGKLGVYVGTAIFGGLGIVKYEDGFSFGDFGPVPNIGMVNLGIDESADLTYLIPGISTGVSWKISDKLAVSGGMRFLYAMMDGEISKNDYLEVSADAFGTAPVFGISWKPTDKLFVSMRHEMRTRLEYEVTKLKGKHPFIPIIKTMIDEGARFRRDFPAQTALGVKYDVNDKLSLAVDGTIAWQIYADRGGSENGMGNGFYVSTAAEYDLNPKWTISCGFIYCDPKDDRDRFPYLTVNPKLSYKVISAGVRYKMSDRLSFTYAMAPYFYDDYTTKSGIKMEKETLDLAFGIEWAFK